MKEVLDVLLCNECFSKFVCKTVISAKAYNLHCISSHCFWCSRCFYKFQNQLDFDEHDCELARQLHSKALKLSSLVEVHTFVQ